MNNDESKKDIRKRVEERIKNRELKMKPKAYFFLKGLAFGFLLVFVFVFSFLITSFILFFFRKTHAYLMLRAGVPGLKLFLFSLPWLFIALFLFSVSLLGSLLRHFDFAWRKPLIYSLLFIIIFIPLVGFVILRTSFHEKMLQKAREDTLPLAGLIYKKHMEKDVCSGEVEEISEDYFVVTDRKGDTTRIIISPYSFGEEEIEKEDSVLIIGRRKNGEMEAWGIIKKKEKSLPSGWQEMPLQKGVPFGIQNGMK